MGDLIADLRYAGRMLRKSPLFTTVAIVTLALGIGLNTAVFSAVDALLLRPLPGVRESDRLVQLYRTYPGGFNYGSNSIPHYEDLRARTTDAFSGVAAWAFTEVSLSAGGRSDVVMAQMVSANYFGVYGVTPDRGRFFVDAEDRTPGAHSVAVVSYPGWQGMFGGDPAIVGREVVLNGNRYTIVGVAPQEFRGSMPIATPVLWVPLMQIAQIMPGEGDRLTARGSNFMNVVARLRDGVTPDQARSRLKNVMATLLDEHEPEYEGSSINLVPQSEAGIHPQMRGASLGLSAVVMAVVVMLLLIACVNVANLFLARARDRAREMAVRISLGARRSRLVRQLLTESLVFSFAAGAAGLLVAFWAIRIINGIELPLPVPIDPGLRLSLPVLGFTLAITLVAGVLFGLAPALQATRPDLLPTIKGDAPGGHSRSRASRVLVVVQMALSLVLLVSASIFLRSLRTATTIDKGFRSENLLLASVDPGLQGYDRARTTAFYTQLVERVRSLPGVTSVALGENVPLSLNDQQRGVEVPGYTPSKDENMSIDYNIVSPGYFEAMGIPLLRGREFTIADDSAAAGVVVVNQRFAQRFFGGADPVGRTIRMGRREFTVVGLVPTGKYSRLGEDPLAYVYYPQAQLWNAEMAVHVRTTGDPAALVPALRAEVAALDPDLPLSQVRTMTNHLGLALFPARLTGIVLTVFGVLGLVLAAVGVYGVMSYAVAQRTREIGIRMAVGAARGQVIGLVLGQGMRLVLVGAAIGLAGAIGASRLVAGLVYGGGGLDPVTMLVVPAVLVSVALLAILVPARRAATVDPMIALRSE